jgi:hypothetical protein
LQLKIVKLILLGIGALATAVMAVVSTQAENLMASIVFGSLFVLGAWSLATFPLGFAVTDLGITLKRPIGTRTIVWREITRISRMPGPFRVRDSSGGRRGVSRQGGTLMLAVGRRRVSISSVRESTDLRNELITAARRHGVEVMPTVFDGEWPS